MSDEREQSIRRRAYELWEQDGGDHGRDQDHWHRASSEIAGAGDERSTGAMASDGTTIGNGTEQAAPEGDGGNGASIVEAEVTTPAAPTAPVKPVGKATATAATRPRNIKTAK